MVETGNMAYFKSSDTVKKNAQKWTSNLPSSIHTMRRDLPRVECLSVSPGYLKNGMFWEDTTCYWKKTK